MDALMTKGCAWIWGVAALLASESICALAQASPHDAMRDEARQLGQQGIEAFWAEQFADSGTKLDRAYELFPTPTLGLWSARARQKLGRWVDAVARYRETIERSHEVGDSAAQQLAQFEAKTELDALMPRVPSITLSIAGHDLETVVVYVDGGVVLAEAVGTRLSVDPGAHTVEASRGDERYEQRVHIGEAQHFVSTFSFAQLPPAVPALAATVSPPPAPTDSRFVERSSAIPISIAALTTGSASIVTSGVLAFVATNKRADECPQGMCTSARAKDAYDALKTASTITFYAGAALAVAGVAGWLLLKPAESQAERSVAWEVSPTGVLVATRF